MPRRKVPGMVRRAVRLSEAVQDSQESSVVALRSRFARIREELKVSEQFPAGVLAEAQAAATRGPVAEHADLRDVPFVTIDPPGSTDLDQAVFLARTAGGFHVDYAIADVPAFVLEGSAIDAEARRRGQTLYAPDERVALHPPVLSENAASLIEGQDRAAFVWRFDLDASGEVTGTDLVRAMVRNRNRLDYAQVQAAADANPGATAEPADSVAAQAVLLREVGLLRQQAERDRGGASLPLPEQEIEVVDGHYRLRLRAPLPSEDWNAQVSLLTGMAAAKIMLDGGIGLLRTMPSPPDEAMAAFRRQARALGVDWPHSESYGDLLRRLRRDVPGELALMYEAATLFRGAGYTPFGVAGTAVPEVTTHAAAAAPYAHVTAPLRRLVDRFGLLVCHGLAGDGEVPQWLREALPVLPEIMSSSDSQAGQLDRRSTDLVEAAVLAERVGQSFPAVAIDRSKSGVKVQLTDPAILAQAKGDAEPGTEVVVRLVGVDLDAQRLDLVIDNTPAN